MPIDYSKYPTDWHKRRYRILERAEHCCEECKVPNYAIGYRDAEDNFIEVSAERREQERYTPDGFKMIKIILTIAHLDHDEENHEVQDSRLRAWCQRCHLRYDAPEKARRRKAKNGQIQINL